MREPDKTVWKIGEKWVGKGGGADGLVGIAFDLFAMCLIKLFWLLFCKFCRSWVEEWRKIH